MLSKLKQSKMSTRFRGLLPVVVDIETSGLNPATDAILEIATVTLALNGQARLYPVETQSFHVEPFIGAHTDVESLVITGIDPGYPLRYAIPEQQALHTMFRRISHAVQKAKCQRAILVGHNAWFDLAFIQSATKRCHLSSPFHSFSTLDTATLAAVALGETVLAKALRAAHIPFDIAKAHSAIYDAERTAELFCYIVNAW